MEREKELIKLINVLRRTARVAMQSEWMEANGDAARFCVEQYNRVFARLQQLDPTISTIFEPLPAGSSLNVVAMACRQLAAYYEDEVGESSSAWPHVFAAAFDAEGFKDFWRKNACDIQDLGEFIRENVAMWARQRRRQQGGAAESNQQQADSK